MEIKKFLNTATKRLQAADIETARLDTLVLLEDCLGSNRASLLAHPEIKLTDKQLDTLNNKLSQREQHIPLAYIRGIAHFYGRSFMVNSHVLIPRPESESLIELLKMLSLPARPLIADVGTGSGCLGITAGLEIPRSLIHMYDIDHKALAVAGHNARTHKVKVQSYAAADLLEHDFGSYSVVLANLPYVPEHFPVNQAASHEPKIALFAGADGLDIYKRFWPQLTSLREPPRYVITESLPFQHHANAMLARGSGYVLEKSDGLAQLFQHG